MEESSYPVYVNLKTPWLAKTFYGLFLVCLFLSFLFGVFFLPSKHSSNEMKAAYFILTTSEFEKKMFVFSLLGTPLFFLFYTLCRYKVRGMLRLTPNKIQIEGQRIIASYATDELTHVYCNDAMTYNGVAKGKLTIELKDKNRNVSNVTLIDYNQADQLMNTLFTYKNAKFNLTNFLSNPESLDE